MSPIFSSGDFKNCKQFCDIRKNLMLKDRKYFVTLGFFVKISFLMSQNFLQFLKSPEEKFGEKLRFRI